MTFKRGYRCKWCGGNDHYAMVCFQKPNKPIAQESERHKENRKATNKAWRRNNPPEEFGGYICYLQIADNCPVKLLPTLYQNEDSPIDSLSLEHVRSKVRHPKLRFEPLNIKPACRFCNKIKASWDLTDLAETYPRIFDMITTPEWQEYEKQLDLIEGII